MMTNTVMKLAGIAGVLVLSVVSLAAQGRGLPGRGPVVDEGGVTPVEIQRMFDAFALLQAQEQLQVSDEQYTRFLGSFKALQDVRRKALQEHRRLVVDLRRLLLEGQPDEAQIKERLQALDDLDVRSRVDIKKAYDAVDQILDVRQRARFRVFEELMERRKLELVTRARQANRPRAQP